MVTFQRAESKGSRTAAAARLLESLSDPAENAEKDKDKDKDKKKKEKAKNADAS